MYRIPRFVHFASAAEDPFDNSRTLHIARVRRAARENSSAIGWSHTSSAIDLVSAQMNLLGLLRQLASRCASGVRSFLTCSAESSHDIGEAFFHSAKIECAAD